MSEWKKDNSRVYGNGQSYNLTNKITATELQNTLNTYEHQIQQYKNIKQQYTEIEAKLDKIQKTIIQLQLTCGIMNEELQRLQGMI